MQLREILDALTALESRFGNLQSFVSFKNGNCHAIFPLRTFQFTGEDVLTVDALAASVDKQIKLAQARLNHALDVTV